MLTHNAQNERLKRQYFNWLREAKGRSAASIDIVAKALNRFEIHSRFRDFKGFHKDQAKAFKAHLAGQAAQRSGKPLSAATICSTLLALKAFYHWLADQPGHKSRVAHGDVEYLSPSEKDLHIARGRQDRAGPSIEQVRHVLQTMPTGTDIERRDRAVVAFALLTAARDGAMVSFRMKHVNLTEQLVTQDSREVRTKRSKSFATWFYPVGDDIRAIATDWVEYRIREMHAGPDDPLFPATRLQQGASHSFRVAGLDGARGWNTAGPIRKIFKEAFARAGLPYYHPHSFRKTITQLGSQVCTSPEEFKSWSQNMGHEAVLTTFTAYLTVPPDRQAALIRSLGNPRPQSDEALAELLAAANKVQRSMARR